MNAGIQHLKVMLIVQLIIVDKTVLKNIIIQAAMNLEQGGTNTLLSMLRETRSKSGP